MRILSKVLEEIKEVLEEDNEYSEIKADIEDVEYSLRYTASELQWDYVYEKIIIAFIEPKTEIDYKVLSIWTTKSIEELEGEE